MDPSKAKSHVPPSEVSGSQPNPSASIQSPLVEANQAQPTPEAASSSPARATPTHLLSADQKSQLAQLGVKVVLPTYLPPGFQLAQFAAHSKISSDPSDYSYYTVSFKGPNNTCIEAGNGYQNNSLSTSQTRSLDTPVGTFKIDSGLYRQTSITRRWAALPEGQVILTGGRLADGEGNCNPIADEEFDQVLQSVEVITAASAKDLPSAESTGNLLTSEQIAKLTSLPITIVAPTYLPKGFRVVKADGERGQYANGADDSGYGIDYEGEDGTCFTIYSSKDGPRRLPMVGQVETALGTVKIYEENYQGKRALESFIPVAKGNPLMIAPVSRLNPATGNYEQCRALDRSEYERILQSIEIVK